MQAALSRLAAPAGVAALSACVCAAVVWADPTTPGGPIPPCPTRALFGLWCPGCGSSRMLYSLLHLDVPSALRYNAVGVLAVLVSVLVGVAVGAAAGLWSGWPATTLLALTDFALALPRVVLLLLLASLWQPSAGLVVLVLGLTGWMTIARLVHGEVRALAARPFVESAIGLGASDLRVLFRHLLPNTLTPVIVAAALGLGNAIMLEAGLSFLGLGVQYFHSTVGRLIQHGSDAYLKNAREAAANART